MESNEDHAIEVGERLERLYREIEARAMRGLPVCNDALAVEAIAFRRHENHALGVIVTPWFMNLVRAELPGGAPLPPGDRGAAQSLRLPATPVDVVIGELDGFGRLDSCSLFSPMFDFADAAAARLTAEAVIAALFDPHWLDEEKSSAGTAAPAPLDRRMFLRRSLPPSGEAAGA